MTPSKLFKLNLQYYKYFLLTCLLSLLVGFFVTTKYSIKITNKYEIMITEDINTKYLVDKIYTAKISKEYSKFIKNYIVSEFINSESGKNSDLDIDRQGEYSIIKTFNEGEQKKIEQFEDTLSNFLKKSETNINNEINSKFDIDLKANSKLFFKKHSSKKGNNPISIYFVSVIIGLILMNFVIILENPPKN